MDIAGTTRDRATLARLLRTYNELPERRDAVCEEVNRVFGVTVGILVVDSPGFTRRTRSHGIIHFLALLERLQRTITPAITSAGGRVLRAEADNVYAVFPDAASALRAAMDIQRILSFANEPLPQADEIHASIGVGYGSVLAVGDDDLFGDEMNLACKLGEDLAQRGEILLTPGAYAALPPGQPAFGEVQFKISGLDLTAYRLES